MTVAAAQNSSAMGEDSLAQAAVWVEAHKADIPRYVYDAIFLLIKLRRELERVKARSSRLLDLFRRELGVIPKSERTPRGVLAHSPEERLAKLKDRKARLLAEIRRYEDRLGKGRKNKHKTSRRQDHHKASVEVDADPLFQRSKEKVFSGRLACATDERERLSVNRSGNFENPKGLHSSVDKRTRHDYGVTTKTIHLEVETVTDPRTGKSVTASTDHIGPPNSQATWGGIASTIIAVIGYAIPINRLATMLKDSCPYFTASRLCFYLEMAADLFMPIYTCLGEQLSDVDVLLGDDAKGRVLEVNEALRDGGSLPLPAKDSLIAKVANIFGRVFDKKNGKGHKRSLNISVVIGKTKPEDPRSYIFFFRSHLGSLGDLLSKMLELRDPKKKLVTLVTDLATTNRVASYLYERFQINHAGCAAHARRPFWRHKDKDQRLCYWMLSAFLILEQIEDRLDELGRTRDRILRYRQRYSRKIWSAILKRCAAVVRGDSSYGHRWPKTSELYKACQYVVAHYPELTRYLDDPRLPSNNNLSERVLRWDKIMQDASKFRATEAGRLRVDILRSIVHTCSAAEVELRDYLYFVFQNRAAIEADPSQFTPYAYALRPKGNNSASTVTS